MLIKNPRSVLFIIRKFILAKLQKTLQTIFSFSLFLLLLLFLSDVSSADSSTSANQSSPSTAIPIDITIQIQHQHTQGQLLGHVQYHLPLSFCQNTHSVKDIQIQDRAKNIFFLNTHFNDECLWKISWELELDSTQLNSISLYPTDLWYPQIRSLNNPLVIPKWTVTTDFKNAIFNKSDSPQEGLWLVLNNFTKIEKEATTTNANTNSKTRFAFYLSEENQNLIPQFYASLDQYLTLYENLFGPYLFSSFSVVENNEETGFGMPSFTLLGPNVLRLPFLVQSSLPHELLHNWWGNGVYVDNSYGNWSESITTYYSDHWIAESQKQGDTYRRKALQNYLTYRVQGHDFPLKDFTERHNAITQAVGYNKGLMVFKMLEYELGLKNGQPQLQNQILSLCMKDFYQNFKQQRASFKDLFLTCENTYDQMHGITNPHSELVSLQNFFHQWIETTNLPAFDIRIENTKAISHGYAFDIQVTQTGDNMTYKIPYRLEFEDGEILESYIPIKKSFHSYNLQVYKKPKKIQFDAKYELVRELKSAEIPSSLQDVFSKNKVYIFANTVNTTSTSTRKLKLLFNKSDLQVHSQTSDSLKALTDYLNGLNISYEINPTTTNTTTQLDPQIPKIYLDQAIDIALANDSSWIQNLNLEGWTLPNVTDPNCQAPHRCLHSLQSTSPERPVLLTPENNSWIVTQRRGGGGVDLWMQISETQSRETLLKKIKHYGSQSFVGFDATKKVINQEWKQSLRSPYLFFFDSL